MRLTFLPLLALCALLLTACGGGGGSSTNPADDITAATATPAITITNGDIFYDGDTATVHVEITNDSALYPVTVTDVEVFFISDGEGSSSLGELASSVEIPAGSAATYDFSVALTATYDDQFYLLLSCSEGSDTTGWQTLLVGSGG